MSRLLFYLNTQAITPIQDIGNKINVIGHVASGFKEMQRVRFAILLVMILVTAGHNAYSLRLVKLWSYTNSTMGFLFNRIVFSDSGKYLGVAWGRCMVVFDVQSGKIILRKCLNPMDTYIVNDASAYGNLIGFVVYHPSYNKGFVLLYDVLTNQTKTYYVGTYYDRALKLTKSGFVACNDFCALFKYNGKRVWVVQIGNALDNMFVDTQGLALYYPYLYVSRYNFPCLCIVNINSGKILKWFSWIDLDVGDKLDVCGTYLAMSDSSRVTIYLILNPFNPSKIYEIHGLPRYSFYHVNSIAFSPDCNYIAVADESQFLQIYYINGTLAYVKYYGEYTNGIPTRVDAVAWHDNLLAVGIGSNATLILYKVER